MERALRQAMLIRYRAAASSSSPGAASVTFELISPRSDYSAQISISQTRRVGRADFVLIDNGQHQHINRDWLNVSVPHATIAFSDNNPKLLCVIRRGATQEIRMSTATIQVETGDILTFPSKEDCDAFQSMHTALYEGTPIRYRIRVAELQTAEAQVEEARTAQAAAEATPTPAEPPEITDEAVSRLSNRLPIHNYTCPFCRKRFKAKGRHDCLKRFSRPDPLTKMVPKKKRAIQKAREREDEIQRKKGTQRCRHSDVKKECSRPDDDEDDGNDDLFMDNVTSVKGGSTSLRKITSTPIK